MAWLRTSILLEGIQCSILRHHYQCPHLLSECLIVCHARISSFSLPLTQTSKAQVLGSELLAWETWIKLSTPDFDLPQPQLSEPGSAVHLGSELVGAKFSLSSVSFQKKNKVINSM